MQYAGCVFSAFKACNTLYKNSARKDAQNSDKKHANPLLMRDGCGIQDTLNLW